MVKKQVACIHCGNKHLVNMIKVYVIQQHYCLDCNKQVLTYDSKAKILTCPKCGKIIDINDINTLSKLGLKIIDATVEYQKKDNYLSKGYEVVVKTEPEKQLCQRCLNLRKHIENVINKDLILGKTTMNEIKGMNNIEFFEKFYSTFQPMLQQMLIERKMREKQLKAMKNLPTQTKPVKKSEET